MKRYRLTLERQCNTWGQYVFDADNMESALRQISRTINLDSAKSVHFVQIEGESK